MLAGMFVTFLVQIFSRYVLEDPFGWTLELCLTLWIWVVFFGNAFVVRDSDQVKFDLLVQATPNKVQRVFALISALAITVAMLASFLPTWDYIDWMKMRKSATLKIPMRDVFSIYAVFMLAVATRYGYQAFKLLKSPDATHDHQEAHHDA